MNDKQIKEKLNSLAYGKEMFSFLGELWIKDKEITKDQYLEYIAYWREHKPATKEQKWINKVKKDFNGEEIEEIDVNKIPF